MIVREYRSVRVPPYAPAEMRNRLLAEALRALRWNSSTHWIELQKRIDADGWEIWTYEMGIRGESQYA